MLTKINLSEARCLARLDHHTDFQKKRLIKLYLRLNGLEVGIYQIPEDHPDFNKCFEQVQKHFRDEK